MVVFIWVRHLAQYSSPIAKYNWPRANSDASFSDCTSETSSSSPAAFLRDSGSGRGARICAICSRSSTDNMPSCELEASSFSALSKF